MTDGPMQPDEPGFPETRDALSLLASVALPAEVRARQLHAIRERAAQLGPPPVAVRRGVRSLSWTRLLARRGAALTGAMLSALSLGTGVAAAASMDDLPGEPLYGLKRAVETVRLHLPGDTADDVQRRLDLAHRRLEEAGALHARQADHALLAATLHSAQALLAEAAELAGGDDTLTSAVTAASDRAETRLGELLDGGLPPQAADRAREAIEAASERASERATEAEADDESDDRRGRGRGGDESRGATTSAPARGQPTEDPEDDDEGDDDSSGPGSGRRSEQPTPRADATEESDRNRGPSEDSGSGDDEDRSGSGGGDEDDDEDRSGSGDEDEDEDQSDEDDDDEDRSGSGGGD